MEAENEFEEPGDNTFSTTIISYFFAIHKEKMSSLLQTSLGNTVFSTSILHIRPLGDKKDFPFAW
jgi:hypothetical protein